MSRRSHYANLIVTKLMDCKESIRRQWLNPEGTATRHFVVDNLLPEEICREIFLSFPRDADGFFSLNSFREKKRTSIELENYDPVLIDITYAFHDQSVVDVVSDIVGLTEIVPDPKLYAGGLSMMFEGDFLNPHLDNSHDAERQKYRRLNLLYYVSPQWSLQNGGNFELWNESLTEQKTVVAHFNRLVVMETNRLSWHSVSKVAAKEPRCCVSNYYFSKISPDATDYFHVTTFSGRPEEKVKRAVSLVDNALRSAVSKTFKISRGKRRPEK